MKSNWKLSHIGIFAKDFDKTIEYYQSLGLAPDLGITENPYSPAHKIETTLFGVTRIRPPQDPNTRYFLQNLYIGDLELEVLHAPAQRPTGEALAYGEGVNHICFNVPDVDGETDLLVKKGLRIVLDLRRNDVRVEDYLDTREFGNTFLSLRPYQMEEERPGKYGHGIVNWKIRGLDIVVKDVEKTAEYYESLGVATVQPETTFDSRSMTEVKVYGQSPKSPIRAKTRLAQIGPVVYEFIQPLEGESIYKESLDRRGEGVICLTFAVENLDGETDKLAKKGVPVIFSGRPQTGSAFAYFDTRQDGGDIMIKLVQRPAV